MAGLKLNLLVPGLFGPFPRNAETEAPLVPVLEALLARADRGDMQAGGSAPLLFQLFGQSPPRSTELPSAALCRLGEGLPADDACWVHADPVHLQAGRQRVLLFDARHLELTLDQATALAAEVEAYFAADGWWLETPDPRRWYLRLSSAPALLTHPLEQLVGRHIEQYLPAGEDGAFWRARLNETQMLLHASEHNRRREAAGLAAINGLWFWGAGRLPEQNEGTPFSAVYADNLLARGLARHGGLEPGGQPPDLGSLGEIAPEGETLVVLDQLEGPLLDGDSIAWAEQVRELESNWFAPIQAAFVERRLERLTLHCPPGRPYEMRRAWFRRWWRRSRPLQDYLARSSD